MASPLIGHRDTSDRLYVLAPAVRALQEHRSVELRATAQHGVRPTHPVSQRFQSG
jgi:hypothetical protein